jgi:hypothetical protein
MRTQRLMESIIVSAALWLLIAWTLSCVFFP